MATRIEQEKPAGSLEPLELTSLRDDIHERPARSKGTLPVAAAAVAATALAVGGAVEASHAVIGPGRVLACILVAAWSAAALFVAVHRPQESLSWIVVGGALAGGVAVLADAFVGDPSSSTGTRDLASAILSVAVAVLVAVGLHLALGLPDGALENRARRGIVIAGYVGALGLAAYLYTQRPDVPLGALTVARSRGARGCGRVRAALPQCPHRTSARPAPVGRMGRGGRGRDLARRGRAQRAAVVAGTGRRHRRQLHAARAVRARDERVGSARGPHRPPARAQHHAHRPRRPGRRVVSPHRARPRPRADRQREDAARAVDARRGRRGAALGSRARTARRARDATRLRRGPRARRSAPHVRQPVDARSRSTSCSSNSRSRSRRR